MLVWSNTSTVSPRRCCALYLIIGSDLRKIKTKNKDKIVQWKLVNSAYNKDIKGGWVGPLLVIVFPCFRESVVVTCKIGPFLCSLDNSLQKNVIVFFSENQISKWRSFEKRAILTYFSHFLITRGKLQKFLQHISHSHTYMYFAHPIDFFALPILKKYEFIRYGFSLLWFLVLILICTILEQSINNKMVSKI